MLDGLLPNDTTALGNNAVAIVAGGQIFLCARADFGVVFDDHRDAGRRLTF